MGKIIIKLKASKARKGHYTYQGGKTTFDNRPKRERTRQTKNSRAIDEQ